MPQIPFLFAQGSNQWECAFNLALNLLLSGSTRPFSILAGSNPAQERELYQVVYVAPDMSATDYDQLRSMVGPGGFIDEFVRSGGVAVINLAGTLGEQLDVAPGGVGFSGPQTHDSEMILAPAHPYFTGLGFGGEMLDAANFNDWQPTDLGTLTGLPEDALILLANANGPALAEYRHGDGRVIVSSLRFCWSNEMLPAFAARNLLRYSRFFSNSALTPAPTVTPTATFTITPTRTASASPTPSRTRSPTPFILRGDANGDERVDAADVPALAAAIFEAESALPGADVNGDGAVTVADLTALVQLLG
jgi:hypothetical protein